MQQVVDCLRHPVLSEKRCWQIEQGSPRSAARPAARAKPTAPYAPLCPTATHSEQHRDLRDDLESR
jgi:hypothetical protein